MYSRQTRKLRVLYIFADVFLLLAAFHLAYRLRQALELERLFYLSSPERTIVLLGSALAWILSGIWFRTYDRLAATPLRGMVGLTVTQSVAASIGIVVFEYVLRLDLSRPFLAILVATAILLLVLARWGIALLLPRWRRGFFAPNYVLIAGTGENAQTLARTIQESPGLELSGFLDQANGVRHLGQDFPVHGYSELPNLLARQVVDEIVFAVRPDEIAGLEEILLLCDEEGVRTRICLDFFPHIHREPYLDSLGSVPLLTFTSAPHDEVRMAIKRTVDLILSALALMVLAPVMAIIWLLIRLTSPGPAIFGQVRCGLNGRRFTLYKFRTMVQDAETRKAGLEHLNIKKVAFKIPNDPRLTTVGRWLRKFSIDEWPQLWNILRGEMSIVGPRPAVPAEVEQYKRWQRRRLRMRPGLTCLWTLAGRDALSFEDWMKLDLAYIDSWSLGLDWTIILRTVPHVLTGKGAN